ncbi:MAG: hypothetical protein ACI9I4_000502 [Neolewinella sp.]
MPFGDAFEVVAGMHGIVPNVIRCEIEFGHTTEDLDLPWRDVKNDTVAGIDAKWLAIYQGFPIIDCSVQWSVAEEVTPPWVIVMAYMVKVLGTPQVKMKISFMFPSMSVVNAIPAVIAAHPGIVT